MHKTDLERLEKYKETREKLQVDQKGCYVLVKGEAKLVNACEEQTTLAHLRKGDCFGLSKILKFPGYTYFGDVIAVKSQVQEKEPPKKSQVQEKEPPTPKLGKNKSSNRGLQAKPLQKDEKLTCLYIPEDKLYLIPFYDLRQVRDAFVHDKDQRSFRVKVCKEYVEKIRKWKKINNFKK